MNRARWSLLSLLVIVAAAALFSAGCNEPNEFNADELWKLEDFAQNFNYADKTIQMMNTWRTDMDYAKSTLGAANGAIPFDQVLPIGWSENSDLAGWYQRNSAEAYTEYIRFDENLTPPTDLYPVKVEYYRFSEYTQEYSTGTLDYSTGDSVSLAYTYDGANVSALEGTAYFMDVDVLYQTSGTSSVTGAGMFNAWQATLSNLSAQVGNPAGTYSIAYNSSTQRSVTRIDIISDAVILPVRIDITMRANSTGEASIYVKGEHRADINFSGYDTEYHGTATWREGHSTVTYTF